MKKWSLLLDARLRAACDLLQHSDLTVTETAHRSGFGDAAHFDRQFHKRFASTPRAWRKSVVS